MRRSDRTSLGGKNERFLTTNWTQIMQARGQDEDVRRQVVGGLIGEYWKPVYCYLRRLGYGNDDAKDLTQGFFSEVVLRRGLVQKADRRRGRFRNFLLRSLHNYVAGVRRAGASRRRRPPTAVVPLDGLESLALEEPSHNVTPEQVFTRQWAATLLAQVLEDVRLQCEARGEHAYWNLFHDRVVGPILNGAVAPPLPALCTQYGVRDPDRASNMIITVKRRFQAALARHVRRLVGSDAEVDDEIHDLMAVLSASAAGWRDAERS